MKRYILCGLFILLAAIPIGCNKEYKDSRIKLDSGVRSDNIVDNYLTRIVYAAFSLLAGEGIDLKDVRVFRNDAGFLMLQVTGYNRAVYTKRFDYKITWLDSNGITVDSKAGTWQTVSVKAKDTFSFKAIAPSPDVNDFRIITRKTPE